MNSAVGTPRETATPGQSVSAHLDHRRRQNCGATRRRSTRVSIRGDTRPQGETEWAIWFHAGACRLLNLTRQALSIRSAISGPAILPRPRRWLWLENPTRTAISAIVPSGPMSSSVARCTRRSIRWRCGANPIELERLSEMMRLSLRFGEIGKGDARLASMYAITCRNRSAVSPSEEEVGAHGQFRAPEWTVEDAVRPAPRRGDEGGIRSL